MASRSGLSDTHQVYLYFGLLALLVFVVAPEGWLLDIQTSYLLKNQLHAGAQQVSQFRLLVGIPVYFGFGFGLVRDLWNPLGWRDRGFFLLFAPLTAASFIWMGSSHLSYQRLLSGMLVAMLSSRFVVAAYEGLISLVSQERVMSGRLSALWNIFSFGPGVAGAFASGYISAHLPPGRSFLLLTAFTFLIACSAFWKPRSVFSYAYEKPRAGGRDYFGDLKRLGRHRAIYPAVLINFLWAFAPGLNTPLQFYLTNELRATDSVYSYFTGIFQGSFIPAFVIYGFLCKKLPLSKLLWWGTVMAVPNVMPLTFIHSGNRALLFAVPMGLTAGIATAAYLDLAMRSCPPGLQGTLMMLVSGILALSTRGSDLLGSWIYASSPTRGFLFCAIATTVAAALILPSILLIPRQLIATTDGEPNPAGEAAL
jgi:hypothetical protein